MLKLTRKTYISAFALISFLLILGAVTFAWFTLSPFANIQDFEAKISTGNGLEVSLDGVEFTSILARDKILAKIKTNLMLEHDTITLDAITSVNGYSNFKKIVVEEGRPYLKPVAEASPEKPGAWIWFNLYFRSPNEDIWVYLLDDSSISSVGKAWQPDVSFQDTAGSVLGPSDGVKTVYAANSLRMSFLSYGVDVERIGDKDPINNEAGSIVVYELEPDYVVTPAGRDKNQRLDRSLKSYGAISYFNAKSDINLLSYFDNEILPPNVLNNTHLVSKSYLNGLMTNKAALLKLDAYHMEDGYYYGAVKVQMWIEGWDPDCYNSIYAADLNISLNFGASFVPPGIAPVAVDDEDSI